MTHALPVILRAEGVSLAHIGGFGLLMLPVVNQDFWAPWVDRHALSRLDIIVVGFYLLSFDCGCTVYFVFFPVQALDQPIYLLAFLFHYFL